MRKTAPMTIPRLSNSATADQVLAALECRAGWLWQQENHLFAVPKAGVGGGDVVR
jgi:hypothetical protein